MRTRHVEIEDGWVDLVTGEVHRTPASRLTPMELELLSYLASRPGSLVDWSEIRDRVWQYSPTVRTRTFMATTHRLRKKIERTPADPQLVRTVHGRGLIFVPTATPVDLFALRREVAELRQLVRRLADEQSGRRRSRPDTPSRRYPRIPSGVPIAEGTG